ncbi:4-hydroxybenzoate polyprenyltransferase [Campylobacter pinnipediorum subsp. pinnipediorum]|uniref:4-hydroxybenzoate polyprenyltransferase n=1 Tax=Campylobacter pinnipediorum subsp. pinnipediorum TaxID=1660067 RepID=A0AAX0LB68_9BACT|nr:menaquinone biosynthesis prenyltransferase MqnP [Campylobacter pinnipediorum]OPA78018.1 4-hydroxybenzoate polyprenyltransferase [Campylobacter pinnipediorum subsp. pinnipediorum]
MGKFIKTLQDISDLIVFKHSVFSLPFIFISMIVASKQINGTINFGLKLFILGVLCAVSARNFAMAFNRYADKDIDKQNPRTANRPSVDGRIGKNNLMVFIIANAVLFIVCAYLINDLAFKLSVPILAILGGYSLFKRFSELAHLVLGVSLGLAPIAGVVAIMNEITLWSVLLCLGVSFWVAGFDLLYSLQDIEFDKQNGLFSIPSIYGEKATMFISALFHSITIIFWLLFCWSAGLGSIAFLGVIASAFVLLKEHQIVRRDFSKIDRAFFTLNGYLGIMFFVFIFVSLI